MSTNLTEQATAGELTVFEKRLSSEIATLKNGIGIIQSDFDTGKIAIGIYANSCNTIFNAFIQKLQDHYPEAILKELYPEHYPLEETQQNFGQEMGALQNAKSNYELDENEFTDETVKLNKRFLAILTREQAIA